MNWSVPQSFEFKGNNVRYGIQGDGPPMVIIHGTPWSSYNMRHLVNGLSRDFTVYYYDLLGYGESDKDAPDVSLGIQNTVLSALLEHWQLDSPDVVAHDFGGATALRAHLLNGKSFKRLVLIDPVAVSPWGSPFFLHVRAHEDAFSGLPGFMHEALVRRYIQSAAHHPIAEDVLSRTVAPWIGDEAEQGAFYRQISQADSRFTDEVQSRYDEIAIPTLILWGQDDTWIPLDRGRELHRLIPGSVLREIEDAGHLVIEERPEALLDEIRHFLGLETTRLAPW